MFFISGGTARDRRPVLRWLGRFSLTGLLAVFLLGALQSPLDPGVVQAAAAQETLRIGGTGATLATITQVAAAYRKKHPDLRVVIPPSLGSTGAIKAIIAGGLDVGLISRPLTEAERRQGLVSLAYARSPLLLVTSYKGAGVNLTLKEVASLYVGEQKSFPDGTPIRVIMRPAGEIDLHLIRGLSPEMDQAVHLAQSREGMIIAINDQNNGDILEKIRGALGWMTLAQLISEKRSLIPLPLEHIKPTRANFISGKYPIFKSFVAVTGAKPTPIAQSFLKFLTSAEGQEILLKNGHVVGANKL